MHGDAVATRRRCLSRVEELALIDEVVDEEPHCAELGQLHRYAHGPQEPEMRSAGQQETNQKGDDGQFRAREGHQTREEGGKCPDGSGTLILWQ